MKPSPHFSELQKIVARLRGENGCPWDRRQTPASIKKYLLEETRELAEAIDQGDPLHIQEETGDLFFILIILCEMFREQNLFSAEDALKTITDKMIRRHPHVFSGMPAGTEQELRDQWQEIKKMEKKDSTRR